MLDILIVLNLFENLSLLFTCFSFPEAAEARAFSGWVGAAAGGEGRRVQPITGAAGEEEGGGPAEHQRVNTANSTCGAVWVPGWIKRSSLPGLKETEKSPEAERGRNGLNIGLYLLYLYQ
jgi:hypothetical protein